MDRALRITRVCAYVLNTVAKELQLGGFAHVFSGEYAEDWAERAYCWVALVDGRAVARVHVDDFDAPADCRVEVDNVYDLIRGNRVAEFEPESFGVTVNPGKDWTGEPLPDLVVDVNLREVELPYLGGARRDIPRGLHQRRVRATGSLRSTHAA